MYVCIVKVYFFFVVDITGIKFKGKIVSDFINIGKNSFDLSKLAELNKSDIEKLNDKKLLAIFNAINSDENEILDADEISVFAKKLLDFDRNQDGKISKREFRKFLKENKDSF